MSSAGTSITAGLSSVWGGVETWAEGVVPAVASFLTGLAGSITSDQFLIIGKAATVFKAKIAAGASQSVAFTAALNELSADEQGELNTIELDLLTFIITISGTAPSASPTS